MIIVIKEYEVGESTDIELSDVNNLRAGIKPSFGRPAMPDQSPKSGQTHHHLHWNPHHIHCHHNIQCHHLYDHLSPHHHDQFLAG